MKPLVLVLITAAFVFVLSACGTSPDNQASAPKEDSVTEEDGVSTASKWEGEEAAPEDIKTSDEGIVVDNVFVFNHINGIPEETDRLAYVLFEYETLNFIKYQVAYLS